MIFYETEPGFLLVDQHEHGLASGEIARRLSRGWIGDPPPSKEAFFAVSNHDLGWKSLDREVLWNERKGRPYSFIDYPPAPKMAAYTAGIDAVEAESPYAALLCSLHYRSFVEGSEHPPEVRFREREGLRQESLKSALSPEPSTLARDLSMLRLSDDLSLYVCFSEGRKSHHPWFTGSFDLFGREFRPLWVDAETLRFAPSPFSEGFELRVPRRTSDREGNIIGRDVLRVGVRP